MFSKKSFLSILLSLTLISQLAACGTVFYPERRGQVDGKIDPLVAGLNAIGLLFYLVPGVIAFAVDFVTGAIYLPDGRQVQLDPQHLQKALNSDGSVDRRALQAIIQQDTGYSLPLDHPFLTEQPIAQQQLASLMREKTVGYAN